MVAVTGVTSTPSVDHYGRAEDTNDFDHVLKNLVSPNSFGLFGSFGIAKIFRASEKQFDAITPGGGEQLLRTDEAELGSLLGAEIILAPFAASKGKERDVSMESPRKIRK